jgi:hypothetical protein
MNTSRWMRANYQLWVTAAAILLPNYIRPKASRFFIIRQKEEPARSHQEDVNLTVPNDGCLVRRVLKTTKPSIIRMAETEQQHSAHYWLGTTMPHSKGEDRY